MGGESVIASFTDSLTDDRNDEKILDPPELEPDAAVGVVGCTGVDATAAAGAGTGFEAAG